MKLIDPYTLSNNRVNDDYYCQQILDGLAKQLSSIMGHLSHKDDIIRFDRDYYTIGFLINKDKPMNRDSIRKSFNRILNERFHGSMCVKSMTRSQNATNVMDVEVNVTDPYKLLYYTFHERFKKELVQFLNYRIEYKATCTDDKYIEFQVYCLSHNGKWINLEYLRKMLKEIVNENPIYKLHHPGSGNTVNGKNPYLIERISWDKEEVKEEPKVESKPSYMDRIKEYAKRLVNKQK